MTDQTETPTAGKAPTHAAWHIRESRNGSGKGFWTRLGPAWAHKDGKGFNIQTDMVPLDGRIVVRVISEREEPAHSE